MMFIIVVEYYTILLYYIIEYYSLSHTKKAHAETLPHKL